MDDITTFIAARLGERERAARAATSGEWEDGGGTVVVDHPTNELVEYVRQQADLDHILLNQPAEVLRDVEATRRVLALHPGDFPYDPDSDGPGDYSWTEQCQRCREDAPCQTVRLIGSRWSTHPDYRPEWAPAPEGD